MTAKNPLTFALDSDDFRALVEEFLIERASDREATPKTIRSYRVNLGLFARFLIDSGNSTSIGKIGPAQIRAYRLFLQKPERWDGQGQRGRPLSDSTRQSYDRSLRTFFKWAVKLGYVTSDPVVDLPKPRVRRKPMRFLREEELLAIWRTFDPKTRRGQRDRTLFLLLIDSGLRASELVSIEWQKINLATNTTTIRGKGGHVRTIGLSTQTVRQIALYLRSWRQDTRHPELLLSARGGTPLSYEGIKMVLRNWRDVAGIEEPFSAHSFRRTMATRAIQAGADGLIVAAQLGHTTLTMTKQYVQAAGLDLGRLQSDHSPLKGLKLK